MAQEPANRQETKTMTCDDRTDPVQSPHDKNQCPECLYAELLSAVARKFPGESRHQTALRYIRQAEERDIEGSTPSSMSKQP